MRTTHEPIWHVVILIYLSMLSSTLLIPAVRPLMADVHGGGQAAMNAFMGLNMLGAMIGAPLLSLAGDRRGKRRRLAGLLCATDGVLLWLCSLPLPLPALLLARCLEGAANVGALSVLMGFAAVGSAHSHHHGRSMGVAGGAVMAAVATGSPLGTLLMAAGGPVATLQGGAMVALLASAGAATTLPRRAASTAPQARLAGIARSYPALRWPMMWVTVERFTVGCFVVTFALHAHEVLGLDDARVGVLFSWFLLPFALSTYPMGRLTDRLSRRTLVATAGLGYAATFMLLPVASVSILPPLLFVAGVSSAAVYASSLCYATSLVPPALRATSMGVLNAGGSLGMFVGTSCAGVLLGVLPSVGFPTESAYAHVLWVAGAAQGLVIAGWLMLSTPPSRAVATQP